MTPEEEQAMHEVIELCLATMVGLPTHPTERHAIVEYAIWLSGASVATQVIPTLLGNVGEINATIAAMNAILHP